LQWWCANCRVILSLSCESHHYRSSNKREKEIRTTSKCRRRGSHRAKKMHSMKLSRLLECRIHGPRSGGVGGGDRRRKRKGMGTRKLARGMSSCVRSRDAKGEAASGRERPKRDKDGSCVSCDRSVIQANATLRAGVRRITGKVIGTSTCFQRCTGMVLQSGTDTTTYRHILNANHE
jgi:hypothetical protein